MKLDSTRRIALTSYRRILFPWLLASSSCPHDWTDYRDRGHGCTLCHTPPNQYARAVALRLGHGDCVWMEASQVRIYSGSDSDARDIQCDFVLVPSFVDGTSGPALVQMNPRGASFAATRPL
jgi:hypothetical protein